MPEVMSLRQAYAEALLGLGEENPDIVVLDADLSRSTMTHLFARRFPERFFDLGLAEQNMMGIAAGLAASGKTPFVSTFAVFAAGRCFDQVRQSIAQPGLGVKIVATHGGISGGEDGASHHAIEDLALACSHPSFTVIVPADGIETVQAVKAAARHPGPFYIRLSRPSVPVVFGPDYRFTLGKAAALREGREATIIALGLMVARALEAAEGLAGEGISCRVLGMSTLKPLDREAVLRAARETGALVVAEEHLLQGGLGSQVALVVAQEHPVPMAFVGLQGYAKSGKGEELLARHGLTAEHIGHAVHEVLRRK